MSEEVERLLLKKKFPKGFRELILCGGGSKCMAFGGAIRYLHQHTLLRHLKSVKGVSAGSIVGLGVVLGYCSVEIDKFISRISADNIFDTQLSTSLLSLPNIVYRLYTNIGINNGEKLTSFLRELFVEKSIPFTTTFADLYSITHRHFRVSAVCVESRQLVHFSHTHTPNIRVIDAVRASCAIPFVFEPVKIGNNHYIDGGLINNFPISEIKTKKDVLALRIEIEPGSDDNRELTLFSLGNCVLDVLFQNTWPNINNLPSNVHVCTIRTPSISFVNLDIPPQTSQQLRNCGYDCVRQTLN